MSDKPTVRDIERLLDEAGESADPGPPTHQERADAWRAAINSEPRTYDELMAVYQSELMGDRY